MTHAESMYRFFASYGIPAYEENAVPTNATMPYITYRYVSGSFNKQTSTTASIWYRSSSYDDINSKLNDISSSIGIGGINTNTIIVRKGMPFAQTINDPDKAIKRIILNLNIEYKETY